MSEQLKQRREALFTRLLRTDWHGRVALEGSSTLENAARSFDADSVTTRLENIADILPPHEVADPQETKRAGEVVAQNFRSALEKARRGDLELMTEGELASTEAVIIADGSRPTLLLQNGQPPLDHPMIGDWRDEMTAFKDKIAQSAFATCRVQPAVGSAADYFGTGFLIDAVNGYVLTNQHVLNALLRRGSTVAERSGRIFSIKDGVVVDFNGEADRPEPRRFKVVEARATPVEGGELHMVDFNRLDIALLKIAPLPDLPPLPAAMPMELTTARVAFCTSPICAAIWAVAPEVWSASDFTSAATTAKPLPASPAWAASIVAFRARRLVCMAMPLIISATLPIRSLAAVMLAMISLASEARVTASRAIWAE